MNTAIHSLRTDLTDAVLIDIMETGSARIYGPASTANRVQYAIDKAAKTLGENVTTARETHGWFAVATA